MKKKLEADLISIAHRILKMKNKSDIVGLHQETQKLYEKLSVLRFVEEHFAGAKPTIGQSEVEARFDTGFDYDAETTEPVKNLPVEALAAESTETETNNIESLPANDEHPVEDQEENEEIASVENDSDRESAENHNFQSADEEETTEASAVDTADQDDQPGEPGASEEAEVQMEEATPDAAPSGQSEAFAPAFELAFDPKTDDTPKPVTPQFSFDDLLGKDYADPVFVKPEENIKSEPKTETVKSDYKLPSPAATFGENKNISLNDRLSKGITIGLNDRIAFMKHLFNNSSEDYNRVLSQLITFDTYEDAKTFIDEMVKPDYNNWEGKEEYSQRFMEIIEKRFI